MDDRCNFVSKKTQIKCTKKGTFDGLCSKHKPKTKSIRDNAITEENDSPKPNDENDLVSIQDVEEKMEKESICTSSDSPIMVSEKVIVYKYIDSYFADHHRRCEILQSIEKKKTSSFFKMDTILPILMMTLAPILAKNFISPNINATYNNQEVDPIKGDVANGAIQRNDTSAETTKGTERETTEIKASEMPISKILKNTSY
jgi:hypothetical protein